MTGYLSKFIPRYALLTKPLRELTHKEAKFHWGREEDDAFEELKAKISSKDTMAFFNPKLPIMVRVEASYNEGLSGDLFQQSAKGWQPVHFISRTLTDVEKRYSQTEKDAVMSREDTHQLQFLFSTPSCTWSSRSRDNTQDNQLS